MIKKSSFWFLTIFTVSTLVIGFLIFTRSSQSNPNEAFDQVKEYIQKQYPKSQKKRAALLQYAEDFEAAMNAVKLSSGVNQAITKLAKSAMCVDAVFDFYSYKQTDALYAEIMSNRERSELGLKVDSFLFKLDVSWPKESEQIRECRFEISKMEN